MEDLSVRFKHLEFEHVFQWGRDKPNAAPRYRWAAVGMPQITPPFMGSVFYLFPHPTNQFAATDEPGGTGCFVGLHSNSLRLLYHIYAVSNRHVVRDSPCIRVNTKDGSTRLIELEHHDWVELDGEDLAAADVTDQLGFDANKLQWLDDFHWIPQAGFLSKYQFLSLVGFDTFMIGLFEDHRAGPRNAPVARFGNVAAVPSDDAPVRLLPADPYAAPAFLNDMRSRTGFSGSPVWIWQAVTRLEDIPPDEERRDGVIFVKPYVSLLGVHRGQIPEEVRILHAEEPKLHGARIRIPSAMTAVIPAWRVSDLLNSEAFVAQRVARDQREDRLNLMGRLRDLIKAQESIPASYHSYIRS